MAGRARTPTRSLMQRRRPLISSPSLLVTSISLSADTGGVRRGLGAATFAQLAQESVGWHEERIFLKDSADDDQWVGSHDVDNPVATGSGKIVRANNRIGSRHEVHSRLVLEQDVHTWWSFHRPVHVGVKANPLESLPFAALADIFDRCPRTNRIE